MGTIYPAYSSFCAIQTKDSSDDKQWLTYWIIASFWNLIISFLDFTFFWLPFYSYLNPLILTWLVHPKLKGAETVFNCVIKPFFYQFQKFESGQIDDLGDYEKMLFMIILRLKSFLENKMDDMMKYFVTFNQTWNTVKPYLIKLKDAYFMDSSLINISEIIKKINEYKKILASDLDKEKKDDKRKDDKKKDDEKKDDKKKDNSKKDK